MAKLRQIVRASAFITWTLTMLPFVFFTHLLSLRKLNRAFLKIWFSVAFLWCIGGRVKEYGEENFPHSLMLVCNHTSYLDIFALATLYMPRFTPKSDVASWPVIGFLCKIAGCFFIERRASGLQDNQKQLAHAITQHATICLFPEGTTGLGDAVLPFKAGLLEIATCESAPTLAVHPVAVIYTHMNNTPLTPTSRHTLAWIGDGDGDLLSHFWRVIAQKNFTIEIHSLPAVPDHARADRKTMANYCQAAIQERLESRLAELGLERSPTTTGDAV